jgi:hypothetical protein
VAAIANILEVLRYSGPVALADLESRMGLTFPELLADLAALKAEGIVVVRGPLAELMQSNVPLAEQAAAAAQTNVELSSRGLKSIMAT